MADATKSHPIPVRLGQPERAELTDLKLRSCLPEAELIRRACRFAFPKFLSGEEPLISVAIVENPDGSVTARAA